MVETFPRGYREIAWNVLRHLSWNQNARDTVEGILNWWLAARGAEWSREQVRETLEILVSRHLLFGRGESLESRVYGLDEGHIEEMERFLLELERER